MYTLESAIQLKNRLTQLQKEIDSVRLAGCTCGFNQLLFHFVISN